MCPLSLILCGSLGGQCIQALNLIFLSHLLCPLNLPLRRPWELCHKMTALSNQSPVALIERGCPGDAVVIGKEQVL